MLYLGFAPALAAKGTMTPNGKSYVLASTRKLGKDCT